MKPEQIEMRRAAMLKAVQAGYTILAKGGRSLDANWKQRFAHAWRTPDCSMQGGGRITRAKAFPEIRMRRSWMAARSARRLRRASLKHIT